MNSGEMENKGVELDLKVTPVLTKDIRWDISGNFSYNENSVVNIGYGLNEIPIFNNTYIALGQPYGIVKGSDWVRDPEGRIVVSKTPDFPRWMLHLNILEQPMRPSQWASARIFL